MIGDICLDRWCTYDPTTAEASRETGIPRVGVVTTEVTPGAGGTVANNLVALGAGRVAVIGAIGEDGFGTELRRALKARGIVAEWLVESSLMSTFTYTKLINSETGVEDLPRVDFINTRPLAAGIERCICDNVRSAIDSFDVVLVADQAETTQGGVVTRAVRDLLAELARAYPQKVFQADSRARAEHFRNVILKPNEQEAEAACHRLFGRVDYPDLLRHTQAPMLWITHGGRGVNIISPPRRMLGGGTHHRESGGHMRGRRQLFRRCRAGPGCDPFPAPGGGVRPPGGLHHHHEDRHRHPPRPTRCWPPKRVPSNEHLRHRYRRYQVLGCAICG